MPLDIKDYRSLVKIIKDVDSRYLPSYDKIVNIAYDLSRVDVGKIYERHGYIVFELTYIGKMPILSCL